MKIALFILMLCAGNFGIQKYYENKYTKTIVDLNSQVSIEISAEKDLNTKLSSDESKLAELDVANRRIASLQTELFNKSLLLSKAQVDVTSGQTQLNQAQQQLALAQTSVTDLQNKLDNMKQRQQSGYTAFYPQAESPAQQKQQDINLAVSPLRQQAEALKEQLQQVQGIYEQKLAQHLQLGYQYNNTGHELERMKDLREQIINVNKQIADVVNGKPVDTTKPDDSSSNPLTSSFPSMIQ